MKKITTVSLCVLCVVLIISNIAGAFCSSEHECSPDGCPVCTLCDSFKTALGALFCAFAVTVLGMQLCYCRVGKEQDRMGNISGTLISLQVKLSD